MTQNEDKENKKHNTESSNYGQHRPDKKPDVNTSTLEWQCEYNKTKIKNTTLTKQLHNLIDKS
jgi:hypothetical protein